ncbi:MAG: hypothetical protein EHM45_04720 [Desulfobacteraceae bacterium]|nr:MAG: hypothetical protein EHM45_04720 [Desulfobacteraceae bacterium]
MIKLRIAAVMVSILLFASLAYGKLSCDLSQGALNGLRVGGATNPAAMGTAVNGVPVISESFVSQTEFYKFLVHGIENQYARNGR